jgi:hypothetical protein
MSYQLRVISGEPAAGVFPLRPGENVVGRAPDCQVVLESAGVSRQHFMIRVDGTRAMLENKGRFGTQIDENPVEGPVEIHPGQRIRFGMYMLVQFESAGSQGGAEDDLHDPDKTAPLPAFYKPELHQAPAKVQIGADDSFFLRNDDVSIPAPSVNRTVTSPLPPPPPANPDIDGPESGIILRPGAVMDEDIGAVTDPSALEFSSSFRKEPPRKAPARQDPPRKAPEPPADDSGLFSSPAALPARAAPSPAPEPKRAPPAASANPAQMDEANATRGLSPEAIAFMRQEWERKAKGKQNKWIVVVAVIAVAAGVAAYFLVGR